jgi:hypothetical protein
MIVIPGHDQYLEQKQMFAKQKPVNRLSKPDKGSDLA